MRFPPTAPYPSRRSPVIAANVVATSQPLAAQAGLTMMARGGNAVDAALAAAITLTVVEPTGNGIGSDAFAIIWDGDRLHGLNASGPSPRAWTPERFAGRSAMPQTGWDSVTVPGAVAGWAALSDRFGRLDFRDLFEPAIDYAGRGFAVTPIIAALWAFGAQTLRDEPGFADHFLRGDRAPAAGERVINSDLARTLELIAESRGQALYEGRLAQRVVADAAAHGAALSGEDLAAYRPEWCNLLHYPFDGADLHEIPPNGQGIAALMALGMLSHTPIRDHGPDEPAGIHLQWEALKLAFADLHAYVSDPAEMRGVTPEALLDPDYLAQRAALIDPTCAQDFGPGKPGGGGTVLVTAADRSGMMVSFIQSNYSGFGSGVVVPGTGIHLQNRGSGFVLEAGHPNQVGPGKRPFHTIIPGFLLRDGAPVMAFGMMGGPIQAQGHVQLTLRTQLWGQDVQTAIDAPRWRILDQKGVACESSVPDATLSTLGALGHTITRAPPDGVFGFGGAQIVHRLSDGLYAAGSDPRRDGQAVGY